MALRPLNPLNLLVRRGPLVPAVVIAFLALEATAQNSLPKDSPFLPPNSPAAAAASGETLEFAGVSTIGKKIDLIIYDKTAKKSRWIPLGDTVAGITALKYDPKAEVAVVRTNGVEKNLALRKGTGPVNAPVPVNVPPPVAMTAPAPTGGQAVVLPGTPAASTPPSPTTPATPEAIAKQEVEARMLVSDLLEIGMAQRKAYEEAHRKAAEGSTTPPGANPVDAANVPVPPVDNPPPATAPAPAAPAN